MSMATPVVATSVGAQGFDFDGSEIVIADEDEKFAEEVICLLKSKQKRADIKVKARQAVLERYSWDAIVKHMNEVLVEECAKLRRRLNTPTSV
jgi:glycosyltransferase involved in cell wall biosynthesis